MTTVTERADKIRAVKSARDTGTPPRDEKAEQALLGSLLLWPEKIDDVLLHISGTDFYFPKHGLIFNAMASLHSENKPIEPVTVAERLQAKNCIVECGGAEFLIELMSSQPHGAHAEYYAGLIAEKSIRRSLILSGQDAITYGYDETSAVDECVGRAESKIAHVLERLAGKKSLSMDAVMLDVMARLDGKSVRGLKTRFSGFDELTRGLLPGNVMILAARPSMGKTAFVVNVAERLAKDGVPVGMMSLEQSKSELCDRLLCSDTRLDMHAIRDPHGLSEAQRDSILKSAHALAPLPLIIDDNSMSMTMLEASARIMRRRDKIQLLIVDYLQIIIPHDRRAPREQQVADSSRRMKQLAKTLDIPIICLAQINREVEKGNDKRPRLAHLRESGSIEQDADIVAFIHRPEVFDAGDRPNEADLIVAKHRNGETGDVKLRFEKKLMQFQDLAPGYSAPPPAFNGGYQGDQYSGDFEQYRRLSDS